MLDAASCSHSPVAGLKSRTVVVRLARSASHEVSNSTHSSGRIVQVLSIKINCAPSESRPRQWADRSGPFYKILNRAPSESRPRQWADRSSPFYKNQLCSSESRPRQWADRSGPFYKILNRAPSESRPRQWADCSGPFYKNSIVLHLNPVHGSGRIVQVLSIKFKSCSI